MSVCLSKDICLKISSKRPNSFLTLSAGKSAVAAFRAAMLISAIRRNSSSDNLETDLKKLYITYMTLSYFA